MQRVCLNSKSSTQGPHERAAYLGDAAVGSVIFHLWLGQEHDHMAKLTLLHLGLALLICEINRQRLQHLQHLCPNLRSHSDPSQASPFLGRSGYAKKRSRGIYTGQEGAA